MDSRRSPTLRFIHPTAANPPSGGSATLSGVKLTEQWPIGHAAASNPPLRPPQYFTRSSSRMGTLSLLFRDQRPPVPSCDQQKTPKLTNPIESCGPESAIRDMDKPNGSVSS